MRVLMVNAHGDDPSTGGAERVVLELARQLVARGNDVDYLQAFPQRLPGNDLERTVLHGTDWRDDPNRRLRNHVGSVVALPTESLRTVVERHRPDVLHTHNLPGIGTGIWAVAQRLGLPVVHTLHDYYLLCPRVTLTRRDGSPCRPSPLLCGLRTHRLARWTSAVSTVIGCSQYVIDRHAELFPRARHHVLRNPIVLSGSRSVRPPRDRFEVLGYVGSLERIKGVHLLLEAASRLARLGVVIRIAGDGRMRDEVRRAAAGHTNVTWVGPVQDEQKERFLVECDLGIVPSVWAEPGGPTFTMAEWLAAGRPVLVSTRGGLGEVAGRYAGSVAVEPDADAIVDAVEALSDPVRWRELAAAVRPLQLEPGLEEWTERHEQMYRTVTTVRSNRVRR
jgi:glycosyltransferase involved in cell wall biosynthesis